MTQPTTVRRALALLALVRPVRVLDAYCCIGGATKGYRYAFGPNCHITGVDKEAQPDYCGDAFHQGDAIEFIRAHGHEFDFIHASPPCQGEGAPTKGTNAARNAKVGRTYPRLITPTRAALETTGRPYVMENVAGSEVRKDIRLCGEQFGLAVLMHRYFELGGWTTVQPPHPRHRGRVRGYRHGQYFDGPYVAAYGKGGGKATVEEIRAAKGIDWSTDHLRLREALPPAYTEWIGTAFLATLAPMLEVAA
ncbi:DNA methylase [Streptomyces massasporeus]|uniref:DNA methylase n=1 Tax=Streptomyces massasporeus TaxID=67324 RepID=UPI0036EC6976